MKLVMLAAILIVDDEPSRNFEGMDKTVNEQLPAPSEWILQRIYIGGKWAEFEGSLSIESNGGGVLTIKDAATFDFKGLDVRPEKDHYAVKFRLNPNEHDQGNGMGMTLLGAYRFCDGQLQLCIGGKCNFSPTLGDRCEVLIMKRRR